ncbi:MAG: metal-dependent hydrolase [Candidatus Acidoferrales bacterium]
MDALTHTLTGLVLARACLPLVPTGARQWPLTATAAAVVAANAPDVDYFSRLLGPAAYLEHRYAEAHSLAGAAALGVVVALVFSLFARRRGAQPRLPARLLLVCLLAAWSHSLMDWTTSEGIRLWWPAKPTWYALDWAPFFDPWLLLILLLGVGLPALLRLVGEEIGAPQTGAGARRGARVALIACALLGMGRAQLHADGVERLQSRLYDGRAPVRVGAFPTAFNPFRWRGVVETQTTFETLEVARLAPARGRQKFSTFHKPESSPPLEAALATRSAQLFLSRARFPYAEVTPFQDGWRARLRDLRHARPDRGLTLQVDLSETLGVINEEIRFGPSRNRPARD